jgi:L-seryl-tRNA(Ser) seleniumtransferase
LKKLGDKCEIAIIDEYSEVGGGSMPMHKMPTKAVSLITPDLSIDKLEKALRNYSTPVVARINKDRLIIDVRTVFDDEFDIIVKALIWAIDRNRLAEKLESGELH